MVKRIIGWVLLVWGVAGIVANIWFVVRWQSWSGTLTLNTFVCLAFIFGGVALIRARPAPKPITHT